MKKIFISYSHKDKEWKELLVKHLKVLEREGFFEVWDDQRIKPGEKWPQKIEEAMNEGDMAILMVSVDFLDSDFIREKEIPIILERHRKEGVKVIPLIVKSCSWEDAQWMSEFQVVPQDGVSLIERNEGEINKELAALAKKIKKILTDSSSRDILPEDTLLPRRKPSKRVLSLGDLKDPELYIKMINSAYLILRVDQLSDILNSENEFDKFLWGWSVCHPERKKKVAKDQKKERRAASIVNTFFVISAYSSALDMPGIGISSQDITTGLVNSLKLRYCGFSNDKGAFGTLIIQEHLSGRQAPTVIRDCRHSTAAISMLLRIMQRKYSSLMRTSPCPNIFSSRIFPALRYLKDLEKKYSLFSEDPEWDRGFPDCQTCAQVLEFLDLLESKKDLLLYCYHNPFASSDALKNWTTQKIQLGLDILKQLKIKVEGSDLLFWDYNIDGERFNDYRSGNPIPPLTSMCENTRLYHTCRILYLLRNLIPKHKDRFIGTIKSLETIMRENGGALPTFFPTGDSQSSHITSTAFFLNSLIPDDLRDLDHQFDNLLIIGINKISEMFNNEVPKHLNDEDIDLFTDGMAMILRLSSYLPLYQSNPDFVEELKKLNESARIIQGYICNKKSKLIKEELDKVQLEGCFPIIKDRVVFSRNWWLETRGST